MALCLTLRRRLHFVPLGSGSDSARSASARSLGGGYSARSAGLLGGLHGLLWRHCFYYCRQPLLFWPGFGFCGTTLMVVLAPVARSPGCPSRPDSPEPALWQGFPIPADNFPNELARVCQCDSVGKSPAWRGLYAAVPSHFVMQSHSQSPTHTTDS